jgi:hypothetical protein
MSNRRASRSEGQQHPAQSTTGPGSANASANNNDPARPSPTTRTQFGAEPLDTSSSSARSNLQSPNSNPPSTFRVPESPSDAAPKSAKVAIPRLKRAIDASGDSAARVGGRHRVNHACEPCRHRKTKCSGERPTCRHCQDFKIACYYADGKRDRVKKYAHQIFSGYAS